MTTIIALIGSLALWLLFAWLASAIIASYLSGRKGFGERIGLASGMLLAPIGILIWLVWPPKPDSDWKVIGPFGRQKVTLGDPAAGRDAPGGAGPSGTAA